MFKNMSNTINKKLDVNDFNSFFNDIPIDDEQKLMSKINDSTCNDINIDEWYAILKEYLGKKAIEENLEKTCIEATINGQFDLADILQSKVHQNLNKSDLKTNLNDNDLDTNDNLNLNEINHYLSYNIQPEKNNSDTSFKNNMIQSFKDQISDAILEKTGNRSNSIEEEYLKASISNDENQCERIDFVKIFN
jgi:hypothetical protein